MAVRRIAAALAGIAVAFVFVMLLQSLTPDPGLNEGEGEVRFERFAFEEPEVSFTEGSVVTLVNGGAVPATFVVTAPTGGNTTFLVAPGGTAEVTLALEDTYEVTTVEWPWAQQEWVVRSTNPFERFLEDLF